MMTYTNSVTVQPNGACRAKLKFQLVSSKTVYTDTDPGMMCQRIGMFVVYWARWEIYVIRFYIFHNVRRADDTPITR